MYPFAHQNPVPDETPFLSQFEQNQRTNRDTNRFLARQGSDIQGIETMRERERGSSRLLRTGRLDQTNQFKRSPATSTRVHDNFFAWEFYHNIRSNVDLSYFHFQLRHVLVAALPNLLFFSTGPGVSGMRTGYWGKDNTYGIHFPNVLQSFHPQDSNKKLVVTSVGAYDRIVLCGGMNGEVICKNIQSNQLLFSGFISNEGNAIVNYIKLDPEQSGFRAVVSGNDQVVRMFDIGQSHFKETTSYAFKTCVNHASISKDGKLLLIAGDDNDITALDCKSGKEAFKLKGHGDFPFAACFHPHINHQYASGAQDFMTIIWDFRKLAPVHKLKGFCGPICGVEYSQDGSMLVSNEPCDNVHIYDVRSFQGPTHSVREQLLDIFGEISGSALGGNDTLYIGIDDRMYRSILEFRRVRPNLLSHVDV